MRVSTVVVYLKDGRVQSVAAAFSEVQNTGGYDDVEVIIADGDNPGEDGSPSVDWPPLLTTGDLQEKHPGVWDKVLGEATEDVSFLFQRQEDNA